MSVAFALGCGFVVAALAVIVVLVLARIGNR